MSVDLHRWCRECAEAFLDWERHEMAMFPSGKLRDLAIVEWTVRVLGNPELPESRDVLLQLIDRHLRPLLTDLPEEKATDG